MITDYSAMNEITDSALLASVLGVRETGLEVRDLSEVMTAPTAIAGVGEKRAAKLYAVQELARRSPQHEEILMTIAQRLEQKAREEGIQLGEQRGIEKGRSEGEREATLRIARTMLQSGIDRNTVMAMTGLTEEDLQRITH